MQRVQDTFLEWAETLPESFEDVFVEFLRQVTKATSLAEVNAAAGMALQDIKGVKG